MPPAVGLGKDTTIVDIFLSLALRLFRTITTVRAMSCFPKKGGRENAAIL